MPDSPDIKRGISAFATAALLGNAWIRSRLLRRKIPLFMSWNLTFKCNLRCHYCDSPNLKVSELATQEIIEGIDAFYKLGTRWVTFSGGEPLMRKDIGLLVNHAKNRGMQVFISTNGTLLPKRLEDIRRVDRITISLDGGPAVHNSVRGEKAWDQAHAAIDRCKEEGIPVSCTCVLSSENLHTVDELLDLANQLSVNIMFQPATKWLDSSTRPNPIAPETQAYRRAIDRLIDQKRSGARISNSLAGLRILRRYPDPTPIRSSAGWVHCTIEPDGKLVASHFDATGILEQPREDAAPPWKLFDRMPVPEKSDQPWCGPVLELDLVFALSPSAILNAARVQR
jgi:MoaA/NifB/PqqE/SkfB family radical SAM enzyme